MSARFYPTVYLPAQSLLFCERYVYTFSPLLQEQGSSARQQGEQKRELFGHPQ